MQKAKSLWQLTYTGRSIANKPKVSSGKKSNKLAFMADTKAKILTSLKDISTLLQSELKTVLASEFDGVKNELQVIKKEVVCMFRWTNLSADYSM